MPGRGVTLSGGVTKWSEKSEPMSTSADEHGHEAKAIQTSDLNHFETNDLVTIFACKKLIHWSLMSSQSVSRWNSALE